MRSVNWTGLAAILFVAIILSGCVAAAPACRPGFEYVPASNGQDSYCRELAHVGGGAAPAAPAANEQPAAQATDVPAEEPATAVAAAPAAPSSGASSDNICGVTADRQLLSFKDVPEWCKLIDGPAANAKFNEAAFVTAWYGGDVYLFQADAGKEVEKLIAMTVRPLKFWGAVWTYDDFVKFEIDYHLNVAKPPCVRDAMNGDKALTPACGE